jgi:protein TonB
VQPAPPPQAPPHVPVVVAAEPISEPKPEIPDDLRDSPIQATFRGLFTIHADGTTDVKMIQSTGNSALDSLALDSARKWTFHPATVDGKPVDSYLRLEVDFDVS